MNGASKENHDTRRKLNLPFSCFLIGTIDPSNPYTFALPGGWKRQTVSNAINGNFCQPKCGEPWTEVVFTGPEGRCQVSACWG